MLWLFYFFLLLLLVPRTKHRWKFPLASTVNVCFSVYYLIFFYFLLLIFHWIFFCYCCCVSICLSNFLDDHFFFLSLYKGELSVNLLSISVTCVRLSQWIASEVPEWDYKVLYLIIRPPLLSAVVENESAWL